MGRRLLWAQMFLKRRGWYAEKLYVTLRYQFIGWSVSKGPRELSHGPFVWLVNVTRYFMSYSLSILKYFPTFVSILIWQSPIILSRMPWWRFKCFISLSAGSVNFQAGDSTWWSTNLPRIHFVVRQCWKNNISNFVFENYYFCYHGNRNTFLAKL